MKDGQNGAIARRIQKLIDVPRRRQRPRFRLSISHHGCDDEFGIVERRPARMRENVPQFSAFMNRPWSFGRAVAADSSRERELLKEFAQSFWILAFFWINLRVGSFEISWAQNPGRAMSRPGEEYHVEIIFLYQSVQMDIDKRQARTGSPVPEQAVLDMLRTQGFRQQRIFLQINHAQA